MKKGGGVIGGGDVHVGNRMAFNNENTHIVWRAMKGPDTKTLLIIKLICKLQCSTDMHPHKLEVNKNISVLAI